MLQFLADENFNGDIVRGLFLRNPEFNLVRVQDLQATSATDPEVLALAAAQSRIILSHDRATMPAHAYERTAANLLMSGVFIISDRLPIRTAIEEILLMTECSEPAEWLGRVVYLPL